MKTYTFAQLQARSFPTMIEAHNPYIYGRVKVVVNVSEQDYPRALSREFKRMGITCYHFPLVETGTDMGFGNILKAVLALENADQSGHYAVVHCDFGNNRSRTMVEAHYYMLRGEQFQDEYKGEVNHLAYNCKAGHLPPLEEVERNLKALADRTPDEPFVLG